MHQRSLTPQTNNAPLPAQSSLIHTLLTCIWPSVHEAKKRQAIERMDNQIANADQLLKEMNQFNDAVREQQHCKPK